MGALDTGMIDVAIAAMNPDPDRDANFTDIYYEVNHGVLVHKDNDAGITSLEDLNGKKIGYKEEPYKKRLPTMKSRMQKLLAWITTPMQL